MVRPKKYKICECCEKPIINRQANAKYCNSCSKYTRELKVKISRGKRLLECLRYKKEKVKVDMTSPSRREAGKRYRAKRLAGGKCIYCDKQRVNASHCEEHRQHINELGKKYHANKKKVD